MQYGLILCFLKVLRREKSVALLRERTRSYNKCLWDIYMHNGRGWDFPMQPNFRHFWTTSGNNIKWSATKISGALKQSRAGHSLPDLWAGSQTQRLWRQAWSLLLTKVSISTLVFLSEVISFAELPACQVFPRTVSLSGCSRLWCIKPQHWHITYLVLLDLPSPWSMQTVSVLLQHLHYLKLTMYAMVLSLLQMLFKYSIHK